jgi:hypothetical protein
MLVDTKKLNFQFEGYRLSTNSNDDAYSIQHLEIPEPSRPTDMANISMNLSQTYFRRAEAASKSNSLLTADPFNENRAFYIDGLYNIVCIETVISQVCCLHYLSVFSNCKTLGR